jgi:serine phosphatase RsbU (regulator of sigma subunit)/anti-sigma regulatory factor (Ser/Thr protein kinase)
MAACIVALIAFAWRDVTARGRVIVELARTNAELAQRLAERTIERDDIARDDAATELFRTNATRKYLERELAREHRASAAFQRAALPTRMPTVPGMEFRALYRVAKAEALVGGDWYDAFRLDDGRIVLSIGDVMGSGLGAAVTMGAVRQSIRGAAQILADPIEILDAADRALHSEQPDGIVTAFVGILDPITLTLNYASAGHPPPFLRSSRGEIATLGGSGLPLGLRSIREDCRDGLHAALLDSSSLLVLYTDGLTEATRDIDAGETRLREALQSVAVWDADNPAEAISDCILDELLDDVAILTIRIGGSASAVTQPLGLPARDARWSFAPEDGNAARGVRKSIVGMLAELGVTAAQTTIAELVFSELVSNVIRHGTNEVEIALDLSGEAPVLHALDRGPGFTYSARLPMDIMSAGGRGLFIVRSLTHDLVVTKRTGGGGNRGGGGGGGVGRPHQTYRRRQPRARGAAVRRATPRSDRSPAARTPAGVRGELATSPA